MAGTSMYEQMSADDMLHSAGRQVLQLDSLLNWKSRAEIYDSAGGPGTMSMHVIEGMPAALLQPRAGIYTRLYAPNACGSLFLGAKSKT